MVLFSSNRIKTDFSFIISSVDRALELQNCISSLENAYIFARKQYSIEIIVVFKGHVEQRTSIVLQIPELFTSYVELNANLARARNIGIERSKGNLMIFIDDDSSVKPDFIIQLADILNRQNADAYCGRIFRSGTNFPFVDCYKKDKQFFLGWLDYKFFMGSCMIIKKEAIETVGYFDERFGSGAQYFAADDSNLFFRLKQKKARILYLPKVIFYHPYSEYIPLKRVFTYSFAKGAFLAERIFSDPLHSFIFVLIFSRTICISFLRLLQRYFSSAIRVKDKRFHYRFVLNGTLNGMVVYLINSMRANKKL